MLLAVSTPVVLGLAFLDPGFFNLHGHAASGFLKATSLVFVLLSNKAFIL